MTQAGAATPLRLAGGRAPLLEVSGLGVAAETERGRVQILRGIDLVVPEGTRVGVVGESGSGKSMTASSIMRLLPPGVSVTSGRIELAGRDLLGLTEREMRAVRGREVSIVYQNAAASLNPLLPVGEQIATVCRAHTGIGGAEARLRAVAMLESLGLPEAERRARDYPHQFSGGMAQRVAIALALICGPRLLIADEPTTGLDATIEAQVLDVIDDSVRRTGAALLLISHDLAVIQAVCDLVAVVYAGMVLEFGSAEDVMGSPLSPYTAGLVRCLDPDSPEAAFIPGRVPEPWDVGDQCPFEARCHLASDVCRQRPPPLRELRPNHWVACHNVASLPPSRGEVARRAGGG